MWKKPSSFACLAPSFGHEQNRLRPFINERRRCRQDLNRKRYQRLWIYCTETAQNSQFSLNSDSTVRRALHFLMGSPATSQGHEKLVYRLIYLFFSTEIFSKRRKICVEGKPELANVGVSVRYCIAWRGNRHGTHNLRIRRVTHARLQWTPEVFGTSLTRLRLVSL